MIGDVVFFIKDNNFISKMIAKMTKSGFTHVGLIIGYDKENKIVKIVESNRFVNTRIDTIELKKCKHVVYTTVEEKTQEQVYTIMNLAYKSVGVKYDYWQIIGLFFSLLFKRRGKAWFNSKNKLICSKLIDIVYYKAGIKRKGEYKLGNVTPQELFEVYDFKVRKGV